MTNLTLHLRIVGAAMIILAFAHLYFGRHLDWKKDAAKLTPANRQIFHVHTFFICLILAMMGILCLNFPHALQPPTLLSKLLLTALAIFWGTRLLFQWFVYDRALWKGHRLNTTAHILFTLLWIYFTLIFILVLRKQFV